ncbi:MAG TPA: hypothetical protein VKA19_07705 [Alphaproteobacteria bacterium]|nr:hypothetical protein [Alphaproteobacteria bacterium]
MVALKLAAVAASTAASAVSAIQSSQGKAGALDQQAALRQQEAQQAVTRAEARAAQVRRQSKREQGERRAVLASRGITAQGSGTDVLADAAMEDELSAQFEKFEGQSRAGSLRASARARQNEADRTRRSGIFKAATIIGKGAVTAGQL